MEEVSSGKKAGPEKKIKARGTNSKKRAGVVTDRDKIACRFVCEQGVMTVEQLWRAVWWNPESNSPRYAYDRVLFLERAGFLKGVRTSFNLKTYFKATKMAQELAMTCGEGVSLIPLHAPPVTETGHSDGMTELRLAVAKAGRLAQPISESWKTDRVLAIDPSFPRERFYKHLPDAIWVTPSGKRIAVEYERTRKVVSRLRLKVEAFAREMVRPDRAFDIVLWIGVPGTMSVLKQVLETHPEQRLRTLGEFLGELKPPREMSGGG